MKNLNLFFTITLLAFVFSGCQQSSNVKTSSASSAQGLLKEGQSIPIVSRKNICNSRVAIKPQRYRSISSRDKQRYLYDYVTNIRTSISSKWKKPHNTAFGASCTVQIKQRVDGCVRSIKFTSCSHPKMRSSVKQAIAYASPLPQAPHPDIYDDTVELDFKN